MNVWGIDAADPAPKRKKPPEGGLVVRSPMHGYRIINGHYFDFSSALVTIQYTKPMTRMAAMR